ncbi:DUF2167 domain-containing protein [Undibacterium sp. Ren11W]|uniref:DUF2167 domain-containing protein n=1 Tax=Undibacterium sp. Ren11W TaxID=3413045 RepID=UPI003BF13C04
MKFTLKKCQAVFAFALITMFAMFAPFAQAQSEAQQAEIKAAYEEADKVKQAGPFEVKMLDQAVLRIPAGQIFIPNPTASRILRAMGNSSDDSLLGVIFPASDENWFVVARYEKAGYIKEDDAKEWNADELLKSLTEGAEAGNVARREKGIREMQVVGWAEKPAYDANNHRLVWSAISKDKVGVDEDPGVNYNTYALGREGYISLNLVTSLKEVATQKAVAQNLLGNLEFSDGKRYADFNASTDKVAEYGLAALVAGVAAKKLGLFAVILAFLAKFAKVGLLALFGGGALFKKWFGRKKDKEPAPVLASAVVNTTTLDSSAAPLNSEAGKDAAKVAGTEHTPGPGSL